MPKRSHSKSPKLNPFARHVRSVHRKTGLSGPKLFKAAKKSYKKAK